ncbi:MAG: DNA methyltransferase [Spirochaetes bacterium GWF1_49_6]|nr:MAG: DNA methyltransferase [Spirochaetes bacterium GWF1_49_6]
MIVEKYIENVAIRPLLICGDSLEVLKLFPPNCIDMAITSPPYWGKREYNSGGIGLENDHNLFISSLLLIFYEIKRVLKPSGSFWLNIGDTYRNKTLLGIPWRLAIRMIDEQGWMLRNEVIWNKVKGGMDNSIDKLGNVHEVLFHFVQQPKYYYNADSIRSTPKKAIIKNGTVISATGVSGIRYKRQIELSTSLTLEEKTNASIELEKVLKDVHDGIISDFRMIIRGQQRATHSDREKVSGRAKELKIKGFYFLKYHPNGSIPKDVWNIIPEDTQNRNTHFAPYPEDLCKIPILATCPQNGIVLDPFMGTGTSMNVAYCLGRKSIGVDISSEYIKIAEERIGEPSLFEAVNA